MTAIVDEPVLVAAPPPPVRRDRMVHAYLAASLVSACGDTVFTIGLAWTAVHLLSPGLAGVVLGIELLPQAMCTLLGGVIADRFDTRRVMMIGTAARVAVLLFATVAWQLGNHSASVLFAVAVAFGAAAGLSNPAAATLMRQLVATEDLVTVGGWSQTGLRLARLLGAPVGAAVIQWGFGVSMLVDAVSFGAVLVVLALVIRPRFRLPRTTHEPWHRALRAGLSYVWRTPVARTFLIGLAAMNVFVSPVMAVGVALRVSGSHWGATWLGIGEAVFAAGAIAGSLAGVRWQGSHLARRSFSVLAVQGLGLAAVGAPSRLALLAGMLTIGITAGLGSVWLGGTFQRVIAPAQLGRAFSVSQLGDQLLIPATMPLFGLLAAGSSVPVATVIFGAAMSALCVLFATRPHIRGLA
ncbi:MFS transporter [Flexivirga meconopsidis]|uniref:MFS transporter n=1 Tax=Flexivirga meconopsidis TaxID=2977121 RepID=UPI00223F3364|nr:MFS transporter [Flexivirga meconopsidis]